MGKRAREKKLQKVSSQLEEKQLIEQRKKERLQPTVKVVRSTVTTLLITIALLWLGTYVVDHLRSIVSFLGGNGV